MSDCKHDLHIANIEREAEVMKNVIYQLCNTLAIMAENSRCQVSGRYDRQWMENSFADLRSKILELRNEIDDIYPRRRT